MRWNDALAAPNTSHAATGTSSASSQQAVYPPLQRVVLEIRTGPAQGRKLWLSPRQSLWVGRVEQSDFVIPLDAMPTALHFLLEGDLTCCRIRDLQSPSKTCLNGQEISEETLCDGDEILAGNSTFSVQIRGGIPSSERKLQTVPRQQERDLSVELAEFKTTLRPLAKPYGYTEFSCHSGLSLFRGSHCYFEHAILVDRLSHVSPMYVIVDPQRWGAVSDALTPKAYLFSWLPENQAHQSSPLVLGPSGENDLSPLVADGWAHDALLCIDSRQPPPDLVEHLGNFAREQLESSSQSDS